MRLNEIEKSTDKLSDKLDKTREENDDLRFQVINLMNLIYKFILKYIFYIIYSLKKEI